MATTLMLRVFAASALCGQAFRIPKTRTARRKGVVPRRSSSHRAKGSSVLEAGTLFDPYVLSANYVDPLEGKDAQLLQEHWAMNDIQYDYGPVLDGLTSNFATRNTGNEQVTWDVVDYLVREFNSTHPSRATVCKQQFEINGYFVTNVIGLIRGTGTGSVTIGAHFDSINQEGGDAPGAEDDASGTAAVIAAFKAAKAQNIRPKKNMYFVAFGGEEQDLYGSWFFAEELKEAGSTFSDDGYSSQIPDPCTIKQTPDNTLFTMDMIGWRNDALPWSTVLLETLPGSSALLDALAKSNQVNNNNRLKLTFSLNPFGSDHESFHKAGFDAALTIDNDGEPSNYPEYHKGGDKIGLISKSLAKDVARMNLGAALRMAGMN